MSDLRTGHCLCGAVTLSVDLKSHDVAACHCSECRRWTGGGPLYSVRVDIREIAGEAQMAAYHHSKWGERAFCGTCGSTLYWRMRGKPVAYVAPGLLDDQGGLELKEEIFTDCRAHWMAPAPGASQSTEAEEMAKLEAFLAKEVQNG